MLMRNKEIHMLPDGRIGYTTTIIRKTRFLLIESNHQVCYMQFRGTMKNAIDIEQLHEKTLFAFLCRYEFCTDQDMIVFPINLN